MADTSFDIIDDPELNERLLRDQMRRQTLQQPTILDKYQNESLNEDAEEEWGIDVNEVNQNLQTGQQTLAQQDQIIAQRQREDDENFIQEVPLDYIEGRQYGELQQNNRHQRDQHPAPRYSNLRMQLRHDRMVRDNPLERVLERDNYVPMLRQSKPYYIGYDDEKPKIITYKNTDINTEPMQYSEYQTQTEYPTVHDYQLQTEYNYNDRYQQTEENGKWMSNLQLQDIIEKQEKMKQLVKGGYQAYEAAKHMLNKQKPTLSRSETHYQENKGIQQKRYQDYIPRNNQKQYVWKWINGKFRKIPKQYYNIRTNKYYNFGPSKYYR